MKSNVEEIGSQLLHLYAISLFAQKSELIDRLYVSDTCRKPLIYSIVLKDDTLDNRNSVYNVLINLQQESSADDVRFRFISADMKNTIAGQILIAL